MQGFHLPQRQSSLKEGIDRTRKQTLLTKWFNFYYDLAFTKDLPLISQSNIQDVKAEKEE